MIYTRQSEKTVPYATLRPWRDLGKAYSDQVAAATAQESDELKLNGNRSVPRESIVRLTEGQWIDDIALNEWGILLRQRAASDNRYRSVFSMTTHWSELSPLPNVQVEDFKLILFPTHLTNHWALIWLDTIEEVICVYDPLFGKSSKVMGTMVARVEEWFNSQAEFVRDFTHRVIERPQQNDTTNCGVWVAMLEEAISRDIRLKEVAKWDAEPGLPMCARQMIAACIVNGDMRPMDEI